jgi:hypothetical protein
MVVWGPLGSEPSVSADSTTRASKWRSVSESNRSLALERRGVSPETQRNVAIVRRLELRKPGLRGLLLEPLCIHDHVWWSASESHRSGYLLARQSRRGSPGSRRRRQIRVPSPHPKFSGWLRQRLVRFAFTGRVYRQLHGWYRRVDSNHLLALKRRDSRPLSYDGRGWCSVLESNQAGPLDARVTVSPGSVPV